MAGVFKQIGTHTTRSEQLEEHMIVHFFWFIFHSGGYLGRRIDRGSLRFAPVQPKPAPVLSGFPLEVEERRRPGGGQAGTGIPEDPLH